MSKECTKSEIINNILDFSVPEIPTTTRFWMIRTKKGYFYHEFIGQNFVALAWNRITCQNNFTEAGEEALKEIIEEEYPDIKRTKTVINKCKSFIFDIQENDILVIPSAGSKYITFAFAGEYFEDNSKTCELEENVINQIENNGVFINEVRCPYKKRRHIRPIRTVKSDEINPNLYRAISNYHGISKMDNYSRYILNMIYNIYSFHDNLNIIFNVRKNGEIFPRLLSKLLYSVTEFLCGLGVDENQISIQININSPGPIDFLITNVYDFLKNNYLPLLGLLVVLGGGSFLSFKLPGMPQIIKDFFSISHKIKREKLENQSLELDILNKRMDLIERAEKNGIDIEKLKENLAIVNSSAKDLQINPIENEDVTEEAITDIVTEDESDE